MIVHFEFRSVKGIIWGAGGYGPGAHGPGRPATASPGYAPGRAITSSQALRPRRSRPPRDLHTALRDCHNDLAGLLAGLHVSVRFPNAVKPRKYPVNHGFERSSRLQPVGDVTHRPHGCLRIPR